VIDLIFIAHLNLTTENKEKREKTEKQDKGYKD
jgi:hypothetical protein